MTQTIWIARHANRLDFVNPDWFLTAERRYDPPLSDDGIIQASQLAQRLKKENITAIFSSPFLRTVQTANQVAEVLDLQIKLELSEWLNPEWMSEAPEKMPIKDLVALFPRIDTNYKSRVIAQYPEIGKTAFLRAGKTAKKLVEEFSEDILLVGHGASVLGATIGLVGEVAETDIKAALCCLIKVVHQDPHWILELNGDTSHLAQVEEVIRFN
jgi:broad specificity phosphatase PhoE